jgi:methionyl aminopeptidase
MTLNNDEDLERLKEIGRICANALQAMGEALEPGITTAELDAIGRKVLEDAGARSAPELCYDFPGATCISVNEEIAHGIPGRRVIQPGDLVNIDVSAEKGGLFADTGASFPVPPVKTEIDRLCRDGKRAMWVGLKQVKPGQSLAAIGNSIGEFARKNRYSLVANLASHGIGRSLHEEPSEPRHRPVAARGTERNCNLAGPIRAAADDRGHGLHGRTLPVDGGAMGRRRRRRLDPLQRTARTDCPI